MFELTVVLTAVNSNIFLVPAKCHMPAPQPRGCVQHGIDTDGRLRVEAGLEQEALELGVLIAVGGVDVDVQPGLPAARA
jgi:hypothetical protein